MRFNNSIAEWDFGLEEGKEFGPFSSLNNDETSCLVREAAPKTLHPSKTILMHCAFIITTAQYCPIDRKMLIVLLQNF